MNMTLSDIKALLDAGNTVFNQINTSEGQVTKIVFGKNFQGLHIPLLTKSPNMGPSNIMCGTSKLFVVKAGDNYYEIHNSKTAFARFQKQKD